MNDITAIAEKLYGMGLCPMPVAENGTKRPMGQWRDFQNDRYDRGNIGGLFRNSKHGLGLICGRASGNLELFEFEGRALEEGLYDEFCRLAFDDPIVGLPLMDMMEGYLVHSPSGGIHVAFRVDGDPLPNTKLARRAATPEELAVNPAERVKVMIETRGQGGFMVCPPSSGPVHPSGEAWVFESGNFSRIVTVSTAVRDRLYEIARSLDDLPAPGAAQEEEEAVLLPFRSEAGRLPIVARGDESPLDWARKNLNPQDLLEAGGWTPGEVRGSEQQWTRPGKSARDGTSATLHLPEGPLNIYSSSVDLEYERAGRRTGAEITLSVGELYAAVHHRGDVPSACRHLRREWMSPPQHQSPRHQRDDGEGSDVSDEGNHHDVVAPMNLPDGFWESREVLSKIRQAAHSMLVSPDAVLGGVLTRYAATIHPSIVLPEHGSLDLFTVIAGHSGSGKSHAAKCARLLLPNRAKRVMMDQPIGSGEGLVEAYFLWVDGETGVPCSPQKKGAEKVQWYHGLHFTTDEGVALAAQAGRAGAIIIPTLCQAWMGETLGQRNAQAQTTRVIEPGRARMTAVVNIQTANGWKLFSDEYASTGLSQRMLCLHAIDHAIAAMPEQPEWPGELDLPTHHIVTGTHRMMEVASEITAEVRQARQDGHSPEWAGDPLDTHRNMTRLKVSGLLALIDDRFDITLDDWDLSKQILDAHRAVRATLQQTKLMADAQDNQRRINRQIETKLATVNAEHAAQVDRTVEAIRDRIESGTSIRKRDYSAPQREVFEEACEQLIHRGVVERYKTNNGQMGWRYV